jgi:hypothetical protein
VAEDAERRNLSAEDTANVLLDVYGQQLGAIGYPHVRHSRRVMKNRRQDIPVAAGRDSRWGERKKLSSVLLLSDHLLQPAARGAIMGGRR